MTRENQRQVEIRPRSFPFLEYRVSNDAERKAAWELYTTLITRISAHQPGQQVATLPRGTNDH